jgi:hypothetical protein
MGAAAMGLEYLAVPVKNECLSGVETGKVGGAPGGVIETDVEHDVRLGQQMSRFLQEFGRLRGHSSSPSWRISCIRGVASRYAVAR